MDQKKGGGLGSPGGGGPGRRTPRWCRVSPRVSMTSPTLRGAPGPSGHGPGSGGHWWWSGTGVRDVGGRGMARNKDSVGGKKHWTRGFYGGYLWQRSLEHRTWFSNIRRELVEWVGGIGLEVGFGVWGD